MAGVLEPPGGDDLGVEKSLRKKAARLLPKADDGGAHPAVVAVGSVVTGWGVGQYPWLLVDQVTINDAAGADSTLVGLLIVVGLAGVIVLPALTYLFRLTQQWNRA